MPVRPFGQRIYLVDARGEIEAAKSLGTHAQVYRRIIIPNAAVAATPTLINSLIGLTKGTSGLLCWSFGNLAQAKIMSGKGYCYFERFYLCFIDLLGY